MPEGRWTSSASILAIFIVSAFVFARFPGPALLGASARRLLDVLCSTNPGMFISNMLIMNCGLGHWPELRYAGIRASGLCLLLIAALAGGCSHPQKPGRGGGAVEGFSVPKPPTLLNGPMALLLTNTQGFRAHAVLEGGASAKGVQAIEGELMGRGGKLVFAPGPDGSSGKRSPSGGSAFIWDVTANCGYLLNDPLQAYAAISGNRQFTNVAVGSAVNGAAPERISGHPCQPSEATVAASDGSVTGFRLWRATDLGGLPVRITRASDGSPLTLTLSRVRLETVPDDLFLPPKGFMKYDSAEALMNELAARQQNLKRRPTYQTEEGEPGIGEDGRVPTRPQ